MTLPFVSTLFRRSVRRPDVRSRSRRLLATCERLEERLVLSTTLAGNVTQGNLYGDQSVVVATSMLTRCRPTSVQVVDTGDIGMGQGSVRSFVPFPNHRGGLSLAVGDFLHKGYHQLVVGTTGNVRARVAIYDLFESFVNEPGAAGTGVFENPVRLQLFTPFRNLRTGAALTTGDFNADGKVELAVGAGPGGPPRINVYEVADPDSSTPLPVPRLVNSFDAFRSSFRGGITLAAGHLTGAPAAELVVGAGVGGGSHVRVFEGGQVHDHAAPRAVIRYRAFGSDARPDHAPLEVNLVESIVHPDEEPVTGLDARGLTGMFTPSNNVPLARGTIVASSSRASTAGRVSVYSLVSGEARHTTVRLPNTSPTGSGAFRTFMTPVGYLFNHLADSALSPTVLVADPFRSTMSLYSLTDESPTAIPNIYTSDFAAQGTSLPYDSPAFPFGTSLDGPLPIAVKLLQSGVATEISPGTSGMLPSRQVAFRSPFALSFQTDTTALFSRYADDFFTNPLNQTPESVDGWYTTPSDPDDFYGPSLAVFGTNPAFPSITSSDPTFWQESMIAAGLQYMNRGVYYQHHHFPAWFGVPTDAAAGVGPDIAGYGLYSYTPAGMQTPGLDCSDFSALVVNMVTGQKIKEGVSEQATVHRGATDWGTSLEGTATIFINNDPSQGILSWYTLATYYESQGALATYQMLNNTLQTGDLLYYGTVPSGTLVPTEPLTTDKGAHVTIWTGQTLPIPGAAADQGVPLLMDSHGGNIQTGVDAGNNPVGVVEPAGPQIRALFVPNETGLSTGYTPLREFLTDEQYQDQNYYYFTNFTHAVRISFPGTTPLPSTADGPA